LIGVGAMSQRRSDEWESVNEYFSWLDISGSVWFRMREYLAGFERRLDYVLESWVRLRPPKFSQQGYIDFFLGSTDYFFLFD